MHDFPKSSKMDASVLRKIKKPLIEKKRRDRINHCINQLKSILLENVKKKDTQISRLDKADILEMTVKHIQQLQKQGITNTMVCADSVGREYKSGYEECTRETINYLNSANGIRHDMKSRVGNHLSNCVGPVNDELSTLKYSGRNSAFHLPLSVPGKYSYHTPITVNISSSIQFPSITARRLDCNGTLLMPVPSHPIIKKETPYSPYYPPPESASGICATPIYYPPLETASSICATPIYYPPLETASSICATPIYYPPLETASSNCATPTEDPLLDKSSGSSSLYGQSFQGLDSSVCIDSLDNSVNNNSLTCYSVWRPW